KNSASFFQKPLRYHRSEVRILQRFKHFATTLFNPLSRHRGDLRFERCAFYRVLNFRQTLISCAFPVDALFAPRREGAHYIDPNLTVKRF
ncbi:MAG: hypothetical protein PHX38_06225, partial [Sulfuricella sp.]|nr:hypothetical protein [Sulfuricella sp.]